jgi:inner membrane protein
MMSDLNPEAAGAYLRLPRPKSAGWGGKALLVCLLALLMAIPGLFVLGLVHDRANRSGKVVAEVSGMKGGAQQVLGPLIVAPYVVPAARAGEEARHGWYVLSPDTGSATAQVASSTLRRGIFSVPVYEATIDIDAVFPAFPTAPGLPAGATVDWSRARVVLGFSDLRGGKLDPAGVVTGPGGPAQLAFAPASDISLGRPGRATDGDQAVADGSGGFGLMSAPAASLLAGGRFRTRLVFTGAERLSIMPFARSTRVSVTGDWPDPGFDGGFSPTNRQVGDSGFKADWTVPFMARGLAAEGPSDAVSLLELGRKDLGVSFVPVNNPYQFVMRALKYAVMFIGLVFLTFFVFEALSGRRLHAAQYVLIGLAQMVFYLLLLSLSEYVGFDYGFAIAAVATVLLIGLYAGAAFRAARYRVQAIVVFSLVYGLIYLLMRLEDFALLAGSVAAFTGLTAAMWLTRNIDWYGGKSPVVATNSQQPQSMTG